MACGARGVTCGGAVLSGAFGDAFGGGKQADTPAVLEAKAEEKAAVAAKNRHPQPDKVDKP